MKKLVSVIIPAYNDADYILDCINSIKKQDYSPLEVIVIDNGSTDCTSDIIKKNFKKVRVISQPNTGVSAARNVGIDEANGEYICFVDADDVISSNMISELVNSIETNQVDFAVCGIYMFNNKHGITKHLPITKKNKIIRGNDCIFNELYPFFDTYKVNAPCGRIYKRNFLSQNKIRFNEQLSFGEDSVFNINYYSVINSCVFKKNELYGYRRGSNYLTKRYSGEFQESKKLRFSAMSVVLREKGVSESFLNGQLIYICFSYFLEIPQKLKKIKLAVRLNLISQVVNDADVRKALKNYSGNLVIKIFAAILKTSNLRLIYFVAVVINYIRRKH